MKQLAINGALYGLPAAIVLGVFFAGHSSIAPQKDIIEQRSPQAEAPAEAEPPQELETAEADPAQDPSMIMKPSYHYYPYPANFMGNLPGSNQLFSFELAVSIFETALNASTLMKTLEEREPQLRPIILEQTQGLDGDTLLSREGRNQLRENIKTQINNHLVKWGFEPFVTSVEFTSFLIT